MAKREVGSLWIGGDLTWLEQACLKSWVDKGQDITLYHYAPIGNVPEGVKTADGRDIIDTDDFIKYKRKDSFALFADWFRLHMIHKRPGMIWIDTDVYCWRPMTYDFDDVYGIELPDTKRVNNAVLGMAPDSPLLQDMLDFTEDRYPVPPFYRPSMRLDLAVAKESGEPVHVSEQLWGVWGPLMITYFVHKHDKLSSAQPVDAFYPVTFPKRKKYLRMPRHANADITENTTALHVWASNKKPIGFKHNGLPPDSSFLHMLCKETGIDPTKAPVKSRGVHKFDAETSEDSEAEGED